MGTINIEGIQIDTDNLVEMNSTELIQLCRLMGVPAHRGLSRGTLASILRGKKRKFRNKVDIYRLQLMEFLRQHWDAINSQLEVNCHADCMKHTDFQVVTCWKTNRETLERYR